MTKLNKKKLLIVPIALIIIILLIIISGIFFKNKEDKLMVDDTENIVDIKDEEVVIRKTNQILTFNKYGVINLYDVDGNILDSKNLNTIEKVQDIGSGDDEKEEIKGLINVGENKQIVHSKVEDGLMRVFDDRGIEVKRIDIKDDVVEDIDPVDEMDLEIEGSNEVEIEDASLTVLPNKSFEIFEIIDEKLVFNDKDENTLILVEAKEGEIKADIILTNYNLEGLKTLYVNDENIYLLYKGEKEVREIPLALGLRGSVSEESVIKYNLSEVPDLLLINNESIYYTYSDKFGQLDLKNMINRNIEIGDKAIDLFFDETHVYVVSDFGREVDNSVLIKIDKDTIIVDAIQGLMGTDSKLIGMDENVGYFRQGDSIKSVDLNTLNPINSYTFEERGYAKTDNQLLFELNEEMMKIFTLKDRINSIKEFKIDGDAFIITK